MLKRVGLLALMLSGGAAFLFPNAALAQNYRESYSYAPQYRYDERTYGHAERFRDERAEHKWREREAREQERRERDWWKHERWDSRWYPAPYTYAPRAYYGDPYCPR